MSNRCPYCKGKTLVDRDPPTPRRADHQLVQCGDCFGYAVEHDNGRIYPLTDRTDSEADAVTRVVDQ